MLVRKLIKNLNKVLNKHYGFRLLKKLNVKLLYLRKTLVAQKLWNKTSYLHTTIYRKTFESLN